jgi:hypothetical protein
LRAPHPHRCEACHAGALGQCLQLVVVAPGQNGIRHQPQIVADFEAALIADRFDRTDEVLVGAHASGDAVHDDADAFGFHKVSSRFQV